VIATEELEYIALDEAYLCQDCSAIGNSAMRCPACCSEVVLSLANVLNRAPAAPYTE
jgi:hypothetical protein